MDPFEQELREALGSVQPPPGGRHDLAPVAVRAHRRRRAVRAAAAGVTTLAVVGAVGLGVGVAVGGPPDRPVPPATATEEPAPTGTAAPTSPATPTSPPPSSPPASSPPPTTATADPDPSTPLVVAWGQQAAVYEVPAGSDRAVLVRSLEPPAVPAGFSLSPNEVATSARDDDVVCVVWRVEAPNDGVSHELSCYAEGSSEPVALDLPDGFTPVGVALRPDASGIAVVGDGTTGSGTVVVSELDGLVPTGWRTWPSGALPDDDSRSVTVAFAGSSDRLVISSENTARENRGLVLLDLTAPGTTWNDLDRLAPADGGRYSRVTSAVDELALAQLDDDPEDLVPAVGVFVDLVDGRAVRTIAHPDRDVVSASGSATVTVYAVRDRAVGEPSSDEGLLHFVVREGEAVGVPLLGLPGDPYTRVVAGPPAP